MEALRELLSRRIDDIIVTGYSERHGNRWIFSPMMWWLYIEADGCLLLLDSSQGDIRIRKVDDIVCDFDIDCDDLFTTQSISKGGYGVVSSIDLFTNEWGRLTKVGLFFKENEHFIQLDAWNLEGFLIQEQDRKPDMEAVLAGKGTRIS